MHSSGIYHYMYDAELITYSHQCNIQPSIQSYGSRSKVFCNLNLIHLGPLKWRHGLSNCLAMLLQEGKVLFVSIAGRAGTYVAQRAARLPIRTASCIGIGTTSVTTSYVWAACLSVEASRTVWTYHVLHVLWVFGFHLLEYLLLEPIPAHLRGFIAVVPIRTTAFSIETARAIVIRTATLFSVAHFADGLPASFTIAILANILCRCDLNNHQGCNYQFNFHLSLLSE